MLNFSDFDFPKVKKALRKSHAQILGKDKKVEALSKWRYSCKKCVSSFKCRSYWQETLDVSMF